MRVLENQAVLSPEYLDGEAHDYTWKRLRREILDELPKATGLPFHIAITRIMKWQETSGPWLNEWTRHEQVPPQLLRIRALVGDE